MVFRHELLTYQSENVPVSFLIQKRVRKYRTECLPHHQSTLQLRLICFPCLAFLKSFASSFQTLPCLAKFFAVDNAHGIFASLKLFCGWFRANLREKWG